MRFTVRSLAAASAVVALASPLMPSAAQGSARSLVVLLAHADDETAAAPALARYAREGVTVHMIIVSDGAAGSGRQPGSTRPDSGPVGEALVKARAEEARCAAAALGAQAPMLLGFPDGKLGDYVGDRGLLYRVTERIAKELERLHPDAVVTWGPDGGTGHPDHRIVSDIATQLQRTGAPGVPERLFYMYLPAEGFRMANPERGAPPLLLPAAKYFTVSVPFTPSDLEASLNALACHRTQMSPEAVQRIRAGSARVWNGKVAFVPASLTTKGDDLFR